MSNIQTKILNLNAEQYKEGSIKNLEPGKEIHIYTTEEFKFDSTEYRITGVEVVLEDLLNLVTTTHEGISFDLDFRLDDVYIGHKKYSDLSLTDSEITFTTTISKETSVNLMKKENIDHFDITNNSNYSLKYNKNGYGEITIYYKKLVKPSTPVISLWKDNKEIKDTSKLSPSTKYILKWSEATNANSYNIYKNNIKIDTISQTNETSYSYEITSNSNNATDVYKVESYNSDSEYGAFSSELSVTTKYDKPSFNDTINFKIGEILKNSVTIGTTSPPEVFLVWNKATNGTNNIVNGYTIFLNNAEIATVDNTVTSIKLLDYFASYKTGAYKVRANGEYSNTESKEAKLTCISAPSTPSFNQENSFKEDSTNLNNISFQLIPGEISSNSINQLQYQMRYSVNGAYTDWINILSSVSNPEFFEKQQQYTFNFQNLKTDFNNKNYKEINTNDIFSVSFRIRVRAIDGGYRFSSELKSQNITRLSSLEWPSLLWTACYNNDEEINQSPALYPYGYGSCELKWNNVRSTLNQTVNYTIKYKTKTNNNWKALGTTNANFLGDINLENFLQGETIYFQLTATDGNTVETDSRIYSYIISSNPIISNLTLIQSEDKKAITCGFTWDNGDNSQAQIGYKISLKYGTKEVIIKKSGEEPFTYNQTKTFSYPYNIIENINNFNNLKSAIISNPIQNIEVIVQLYNNTFSSCSNTLTKTFQLDFSQKPTAASDFKIANSDSWLNPGIIYNLSFKQGQVEEIINSKDTTTPVTLEYIITKNGKEIKPSLNFDKNTGVYSFFDIAEAFDYDQKYTYILKTTQKYNEGYTTKADKQQSTSITIARWSNVDKISLSDLQVKINQEPVDDTKPYIISGKIILPAYLCGSKDSKISNVKKEIEIFLYNTKNKEDSIGKTTVVFEEQDITKEFSQDFSINIADKLEDVEIYAKVIFTNINNNTYEKITPYYYLLGEGVSLAIRKGRIGINVNSNSFKVNNSDEGTEKNSSLFIQSGFDQAPILELNHFNGKHFIKFTKNNLNDEKYEVCLSKEDVDNVPYLFLNGNFKAEKFNAENLIATNLNISNKISGKTLEIEESIESKSLEVTNSITTDALTVQNSAFINRNLEVKEIFTTKGLKIYKGLTLNDQNSPNKGRPTLEFYHDYKDENNYNTLIGAIQMWTTDQIMSFRLRHRDDSNGEFTYFHLPTADRNLTTEKRYQILTTKTPVGIEHGGTGATTSEGALKALGFEEKIKEALTGVNSTTNKSYSKFLPLNEEEQVDRILNLININTDDPTRYKHIGLNLRVRNISSAECVAYIRNYGTINDDDVFRSNMSINATSNIILACGAMDSDKNRSLIIDHYKREMFLLSPNNIYFYTGGKTNGTNLGEPSYLDSEGFLHCNGVSGDAIRYGSETPTTNLIEGQIWLKPVE